MLIYSIPLIYVAADSPAISPTTPPPKAITVSFRESLLSSICRNISSYVCIFFEASPFLKICTEASGNCSSKIFFHFSGTPSSLIINTLPFGLTISFTL